MGKFFDFIKWLIENAKLNRTELIVIIFATVFCVVSFICKDNINHTIDGWFNYKISKTTNTKRDTTGNWERRKKFHDRWIKIDSLLNAGKDTTNME